MTYALLLAIAFDGRVALEFSETEIYQPIERAEAAVSPDGHLYLLDAEETKVLHFGPKGERLADIGGKGQGPGEFTFPERIYFEDGKLYVFDLGEAAISAFEADGSYIDRYALPSRGLAVAKVKGGWIHANWMFSMDPKAPVEVVLRDNALGDPVKLLDWPRTADAGMRVMIRSDGKTPKVPFNPVRDRPAMAVSPDGGTVYVSHPGKLKISVVDVAAKKVGRVIEKDLPAIPFNKAYGDKRLQEMMDASKRNGGLSINFTPDYPDHFPLVRGLFVAAGGELVVQRWGPNPDEANYYSVFNAKGGEAELPYDPEHEPRVLAIRGDKAYLAMYRDGEAYVAVCEAAQLNAIAKANPVIAEDAGALFMIRN